MTMKYFQKNAYKTDRICIIMKMLLIKLVIVLSAPFD